MLKNITRSLENRVRSSVTQTEENASKMSTGKRINTAADDAAGMAISSRTNTRIKSIITANRNINNALEAVSVADTGANLVSAHLERMRELAIQSANGAYTDADRALMQFEYQSHQESIQTLSLNTIAQDHMPVLNAGWIQLAFAIDTSASMGAEIINLQSAINGGTSSLASLLENNSIYTQFGLTAVGANEDPTDGADTRAALGAPEFSDELDALSLQFMREDPYAAVLSMLGVLGNDDVGFSSIADQRHIVYITDTGREYTADATASKQAAIDALKAKGVTLHVIANGGGPNALNDLATETGGLTFNMASDGSNISSSLDDINDLILEDAVDKRPTPMLVGPDSDDVINAELPINLTLNALGIQFSSSDIKTVASANASIHQVDEAFQHLAEERAQLSSTFNQLQSALSDNLNLHVNSSEMVSKIEDADLAQVMSSSVGLSLRSASSTEMLQKWFQVRSETLRSLLN